MARSSRRRLRIGLAHLPPVLGDPGANQAAILAAFEHAAARGCGWVVAGELASTGYDFVPVLGTDWIEPLDGDWIDGYSDAARDLGVSVFVHLPERDARTGTLHSTLFAIASDGRVAGRHRKIAVIPGAESWAEPGTTAEPVIIDGVVVGLLVCADAYPPGIAARLAEGGAQVFISSAAWKPGEHGPAGEWDRISGSAGAPVVVCNRTGVDTTLDFRQAESVVSIGGRTTFRGCTASPEVFVVEVDVEGSRGSGPTPR